MTVIYLRAASESALIGALQAAGMWDEDAFRPLTVGDALDVIGTIYKPTGEVVDGIPQVSPVEGYHANLMLHGDIPEAVEAIQIQAPATPRRCFAGH